MKTPETTPAQPVDLPRLVSLAARWLEEAAKRRKHVAEEKALGGRDNDAEIGYAECLEDKAAELKAWAGSEANRELYSKNSA